MSVPMLRDRQVVGAITVNRAETRGFTPTRKWRCCKPSRARRGWRSENVRLFNETREALEQADRHGRGVWQVIRARSADTRRRSTRPVDSCERRSGRQMAVKAFGRTARYPAACARELPSMVFVKEWAIARGQTFTEGRSASGTGSTIPTTRGDGCVANTVRERMSPGRPVVPVSRIYGPMSGRMRHRGDLHLPPAAASPSATRRRRCCAPSPTRP
jgi:hypothetical protein